MEKNITEQTQITNDTIEQLLNVDKQISTRLGVLVVLLAGVIIILFATLIRENLPDLFNASVVSGPSIRQNPKPDSYADSYPISYPDSYILEDESV